MDLVPKRGKITRYRRRLQAAKKVTKKAKKELTKGVRRGIIIELPGSGRCGPSKEWRRLKKIRKNLLTDGFRSDIMNRLSLRKRPRALKKIQKRA